MKIEDPLYDPAQLDTYVHTYIHIKKHSHSWDYIYIFQDYACPLDIVVLPCLFL